MIKISKLLFLVFLLLSGCARAFQPPPVEYTTWVMNNASKDQIIKQMLKCGFPNAAGFAGRSATIEEAASAEQCMFKSGFKKKNGSGGICSWGNSAKILACNKN